MMKESDDGMLFVYCPKCGRKLLRAGHGKMEVPCSNNKCNYKWNVNADNNGITFLFVENYQKGNATS